MKVTVGKNSLVISGREVSFKEEVFESLQLPDRVIVLLNPADFADEDPFSGRNIVCLDEKGELLWRIEDAGVTRSTADGREIPDPFTGIELNDDGKTIEVGIAAGVDFDLDPETGEISNPVFTK